jgi:hypothetical protein
LKACNPEREETLCYGVSVADIESNRYMYISNVAMIEVKKTVAIRDFGKAPTRRSGCP